MATKFVTTKTTLLYENATGQARSMILIFGDEVTTNGGATNGRLPVKFRGRDGFITKTSLADTAALELYFIDVGQGDSTFVITPSGKKILIDGGANDRALRFLAWRYRLDQPANSVAIDLLVLTHADADHIKGLIPIIQHPRINVKRVIHSGIATFRSGAFATGLGDKVVSNGVTYLKTRHSQLSQLASSNLSADFTAWAAAINAELTPSKYEAVSWGTPPISLGDPDVNIEVLGPRLEPVGGQLVYRWFGDEAHTINGHSVVLRLTYKNVQVLLSGDLNIKGSDHLLSVPGLPSKLSAHVFKAPHHGSHEFSPAFLAAVRPQISVVSSGDDPDHGHPRAVFLGAIGNVSRSGEPLLFSTEIAATFKGAGVPPSPTTATPGSPAARMRELFIRRLHGMINVRSDGSNLYAARRVDASYQWEAYGPVPSAP